MNDESLFVITTNVSANVTISGPDSYSKSIETTAGRAAALDSNTATLGTTAGTATYTILLTADDYSSRAYTIVVTRQAWFRSLLRTMAQPWRALIPAMRYRVPPLPLLLPRG